MKELRIICCPPLSLYETPPKDHSKSELDECPICKKKMWLSEKKKALISCWREKNLELFLSCYLCLPERMNKKDIKSALKKHGITEIKI